MVLLLLECLAFLLATLCSDSFLSPGLWEAGLAGVGTTLIDTVERIAKPSYPNPGITRQVVCGCLRDHTGHLLG